MALSTTSSTTPPSHALGTADWELLAVQRRIALFSPHVLRTPFEYYSYFLALPERGVNFTSEIVLVLSLPTAEGCAEPAPSLDHLIVDLEARLVYGVFTRASEPSCAGLVAGFTFLVAVDRGAVPREFDLQAERTLIHPQAVSTHIVLDDG